MNDNNNDNKEINNTLDDRTVHDFLVYANSVIKSRAIPFAEDNLKPIHRKILYTLYEEKVTPDKKTKKCVTLAGAALKYSPHGDASVYGAMVRLAQWWKLRYPLIEMQGNCGNILGDSAAASRYTECRLSPIGMYMLDGLDKNAVDFKPNYDGTLEEPVTLPSKFPYLLCGNNSGIAVGMSSDIVSHNFTEVAAAINYYLENKDTCTIADLMKFIKGPDFPTGGKIINGDDLYDIYSTGRGAVRIQPHYDVVNAGGGKINLVFHDLPYGVDIDSGIKAPLKKLVIDEGYEQFTNIDVKKVGPHNFDIIIGLARGSDVASCLNILFTKTRLADSIKINQTVIVDGEPKLLNLKQMIEYWVNYRSNIIKRVASNDYAKTNHKLTVTLGLQKCMSDIDLVIKLIRESDNKNAAKIALMKAFELSDEQADAVLDIKLSRLSRLDLQELNDTEKELEKTLAHLKNVIEDEKERFKQISNDLAEIKKFLGKDERLTEIVYHDINNALRVSNGDAAATSAIVKREWYIYPNGLGAIKIGDEDTAPDNGLIDVVVAYDSKDIWGYNKAGEIAPISKASEIMPLVGAFVKDGSDDRIVTITKNGNVKVSSLSDFKLNKAERAIKIKEGDELKCAATFSSANSAAAVLLFNGEQNVLKLKLNDLTVASRLTTGVKSGFATIFAASVSFKDSDVVLTITKDNKGKYTAVKDFTDDKRGNKGQSITENTVVFKIFTDGRSNFFAQPKMGVKLITIPKTKISLKGKTAAGASITNRAIINVI